VLRRTNDGGTLTVNFEELRALVLEDPAFEDAAIELARPGENARITFICDAVDARMLVGSSGEAYPGTLGAPDPVTSGRVNVLTRLAIFAAGEIPSVFRGQRSTLLDMHHAEPETPFHQGHVLAIAFKVKAGLADTAYHDAILKAELGSRGGSPKRRSTQRRITSAPATGTISTAICPTSWWCRRCAGTRTHPRIGCTGTACFPAACRCSCIRVNST
jgi:hypothetical protein